MSRRGRGKRPVCLVLCVGKDCRDAKGFDALRRAASELSGSQQVPCQGLCHGPIVGVQERDGVRWYSRARTKRMRRALAEVLGGERPSKRLRAVEVRKRRGELRHPRQVRPLC